MLDQSFYQQLDAFYAAGDAAGAEAFLVAARDRAELEESQQDLATIYNELMGHYRTAGDWVECERAMKGLLRAIRALHLKRGLEWATFTLNIANAQRAMGMLAEAERNFLMVRDEYEAALEPGDFRLASLYNNLGLTYKAKGQSEIARNYFEKALAIVRELDGAGTAVAATCSNLADLLTDEGDLDAASAYAHQAIEALAAPGMPLGVDFSAALAAAARIDFARGDLEEAIELYSRAADALERAFGKTRAYGTICRNLAQVYRVAGMEDEALRMEDEAKQAQA
jgi:tetratricopeptide (TPR) repeat protein